jgi:hypothetical protein
MMTRYAGLSRNTILRGIVAILCILVAGTLEAADQTEHLKKTPTVLADPGDYIDSTSGRLSYERAAALVKVAFPDELDTNSPDFYCAIHVVRWGADATSVDKSYWYIYRGRGGRTSYGGRWTPARFEGTRIYGTDRLAVLYVHVNVPAVTRAAALKELAPTIARGLPKPGGAGDYTLEDLLPENSNPAEAVKSSRGQQHLRLIGTHIVESSYTNVHYQIDVVKKLPSPIQNLHDAIGMVQAAATEQPFVTLTERVGLYAGDIYDIHHVPSDVTITGQLIDASPLESKTLELGKQTYDNEGLYYWDVSLGIPVTSVTQLDFEASGGQVFAKEIDSTQLMALMNIFWRPMDTKNVTLALVPSPIVGVALSKKPLNKILVGLSMGLNKVQVYGGRQWSQIEKAPVAAEEVTAPTTNTTEYQANWVVGINVPVRQVIDFLKAKK